jgi:hypothetical protein
MNVKHLRAYLILCSLVVILQPLRGLAQQNSDAAKTGVQHTPAERDGQHDFDFAGHIEGLTLRLYNPQSRQWSLYWATSKGGPIYPPQIGEFKNGRGEFFGQDTLNGKAIFIRFVWSDTTTNTPHFEQSFSDDGGKTWEVNWITDQTRVKDESDKAQ